MYRTKTEKAASELRETAAGVKDAADRGLARAGEGLSQAGEAVAGAMREVHVEEFHLRGGVGDHPFEINLEDKDGERFLAFDVTVQSPGGDYVRITGRKSMGDLMRTSSGQRSASQAETVEATPARPTP